MTPSYRQIAPFLTAGKNRASRWFSYTGLGVGVLLLLCSLQMYLNINLLLKERNPKKDGFDYISVTKTITNENMSADHSFTGADINDLKNQTFITDATPLVANKFLVKASGGSTLPFTTDLFLEAIDNQFLDTIPPDFTWKPGQDIIPLMVASDYLELYNTVFAPANNLPQFSAQSVSALVIQVLCYGADGTPHVFRGRVVALSDRINSVLAPLEFLNWANENFGGGKNIQPSRIFIKTKDANSPELLGFLQQHNYNINKDRSKFGRIKFVLQAIVSGLAGFGLLVVLLAMMLFSFYLQLMIARSKANLQLLLTLGYSPGWLSKTVAKKWIPVYVSIIFLAWILSAVFQWYFQQHAMGARADLSAWLAWPVTTVAVLLLALSILVNYRMISKLLRKL